MIATVVQQLAIRNLRNLSDVDVQLSPGVNVLWGDNAQGKTSVLEAIYLMATTRSFRTHRVREMITRGQQAGSVRGQVKIGPTSSEQLVGISKTQRSLRVDGEKPKDLASFATRVPVVAFHPGELNLTMGPASGRRTLLDRVALYMNPSSYDAQRAYVHAMRSRWKLLQQGASGSALGAYEQVMAEQGADVTAARRDAVELLMAKVIDVFSKLAPEGTVVTGRYRAGGSVQVQEIVEKLEAQRAQDSRRAAAGFGPHRDELVLQLNGATVRTDASQGQHRLLTLTLKLAEMECIAESVGVRPVLLLDDVSSELDAGRTAQLFRLVAERRDQMLVTTTRPELLTVLDELVGGMQVFEVEQGRVERR